jgi:hypothetical protein
MPLQCTKANRLRIFIGLPFSTLKRRKRRAPSPNYAKLSKTRRAGLGEAARTYSGFPAAQAGLNIRP